MSWTIIAIIIAGIALLIFIILLLTKPGKADPANPNLGPGVTGTLSYPVGNYSAWADELEKDMDYAGTDEDAITGTLAQMKNDADVSQLANTFGRRVIDYFNVLGLFSGTQTYNLWTALKSELGQWYIDTINEDWSAKGITYRI